MCNVTRIHSLSDAESNSGCFYDLVAVTLGQNEENLSCFLLARPLITRLTAPALSIGCIWNTGTLRPLFDKG